jgi:Flp pilus assembly protein TadG
MLRKFKDCVIQDRGVAAIEVAFILPFLLLLYFGLFDLTALISFNRKVTYSAGAMADLVTQHKTSLLKSDVTDYYSAVRMVMAPLPNTDVRIEVRGYRKSGATISQVWSTNSGSGPSCGAAPSTSGMNALMTAGNDLVVARVCMLYTPYVATFMGKQLLGATSFSVTESITQRPRSSLQITCYNTTVGGAVCS